MKLYLPEGKGLAASRPQLTPAGLRRAMERGTVLEAVAVRCDEDHALWLELGEAVGKIPREEAALGVREGTVRETAILSRVGRPVCFCVTGLRQTPEGLLALCSRRLAQQPAQQSLLDGLRPGDILPAVVAGLAPFGAFCDLGRGVLGLLPNAGIAVSRTEHAAERFVLGQEIVVAARRVEAGRITLSHRELLGTWMDNAVRFAPGQIVPGVVRSVMPYGAFVELRPNLSGLCPPREELRPGDRVLIAEACTHNAQDGDIGRVKIPALLRKKVGGELQIDVVSGADFKNDLSKYALIIHCGACMFNRKYVLSRIAAAQHAGVPITNYGIALAKLTGILPHVELE